MKLGKGVDPRAFADALAMIEDADPLDSCVPALLERAEASKAASKGVAAAVDASRLGAALRGLLAERADEPDEGTTERLLRRARGADVAARVRRNPIHRNEAFTCAHCGHAVPPAPSGVRNHCPRCLRSLHVDGAVPGDRAADCGGVMHPVALETTGGLGVRQRCARCGHERMNRLHPEWSLDPDVVPASLSSERSG